ncbi:2-succinylbenzoate--CoA ligase, chloroplastic/peroxisomal isoform X2 [Macadamia integrifolia]|uniref:2-succinylbenzoate--CoA ligase, chloroplastic/peroxisomal isoform X2 n=1 Tax=Macadamia integrifolia TaxID=60698 RepID=UPI001C4E6623|nr:2-succinylbenzoate--CoA ligase, chloroplastic/peroxisomal isoform X2 [Macadamia integrifolia]XP_042502007.1 2-succinylbenzoate--CoA ligase, chloroplastic/peroxisomal isoform X2 [Macadamia integrifolia]
MLRALIQQKNGSFDEARLAIEAVTPVMLVVDESCSFWSLELQNTNLDFLRWHAFLGEISSFHSNTGNVLTTETLKKPSQISKVLDYAWAPEGIALICFTSGTTGRPKGVSITHTALIVQSLAKIAIVGYNEDDVYLHTAPLCHIGGISSGMAMLMVGACHILIPKFEVESALKAIEHHQVSSLLTVPAMMADMVSNIRKNKAWKGGEHVKKILNGGGGLSVEMINNAATIFPCAKIISAYGMTETCSSLTFMILYDPGEKKSDEPFQNICGNKSSVINKPVGICVGKPAPHVELQIHGDGSSLIGRILTRGPHVMLRYWDQAPAAVSKLEVEGWLDTGDIGWIDDYGALWLIGRLNDRIKSGGENVYPEEVEAVLRQYPGVSSAVVVGLPDSRLTEMVAACIQIKEEWQWNNQITSHQLEREDLRLSSDILQLHCKQRNLTGFKIPKIFILWRKPFPLTTTGKLRREEVRRQVMAHPQVFPSHL